MKTCSRWVLVGACAITTSDILEGLVPQFDNKYIIGYDWLQFNITGNSLQLFAISLVMCLVSLLCTVIEFDNIVFIRLWMSDNTIFYTTPPYLTDCMLSRLLIPHP